MKKACYILSVLLGLCLSGCNIVDYSRTIYTSFYPLYDFTKRIVGDKFEVKNLTPAGQEPHDYEPTPKEVGGLVDSPIFLYHGLGVDSWVDSLPDSIEKKSYEVSDNIETISLNGIIDPHTWLSIPNAITEMNNIYKVIVDYDPMNASYYENNFNKAKKEFEELDKQYRETVKELSSKYLAVSHAAFGYLCKEYGLNQIYLSGLEPDALPSAKDKERIMETIKEYNVSTIFYEELASDELAKNIASELGIKVDTLNPIEGLTEEELNNGEDYLSVMKDNLTKIKEALK